MPRLSSRKRPLHPLTSPTKSAAEKRADVYSLLGVTEEATNSAPKITHILKELDGGLDRALEFLRGSDEPDTRKLLAVYDTIAPSNRNLVPFEAYALAAGLTPKRVLELVMGACFDQSAAATSLIAKAAHPSIVRATVENALHPDGVRDREMLHKHAGFVPVPKTNVVNVRGDFNQDNRLQSISVAMLGSIEDKRSKIANRFNERLGITAKSEPVDAELVIPSDPPVD